MLYPLFWLNFIYFKINLMTVTENITLAPVELDKMEKDKSYQRAADLLKNIDLIEK